MKYKIEATPNFVKEFKHLAKKYPSLNIEIQLLESLLEQQPFTGTSLGKGCYKIRLAVSSKKSGKSGGTRVITYMVAENETVYLISIYDKSEKENIDVKILQKIIKSIK